jgi:hypothetical protein
MIDSAHRLGHRLFADVLIFLLMIAHQKTEFIHQGRGLKQPNRVVTDLEHLISEANYFIRTLGEAPEMP